MGVAMPHPEALQRCPLWPNAEQTPTGRTPSAASLRRHVYAATAAESLVAAIGILTLLVNGIPL